MIVKKKTANAASRKVENGTPNKTIWKKKNECGFINRVLSYLPHFEFL
jgi:hypothetical protein